MTDLTERLRQLRILPVIVIETAETAVPLARALADGGLPAAEITYRTAAAPDAIRRIAAECPGVLVGAGTVRTPAQVDDARMAGARFIVSPGFSRSVVERAREHELPVYPGVCTPTEIESACEAGISVLKFFPAEPMGGLGFLKAIAAPYGDVRFIPTGGINVENVASYLAFGPVVACGGSWMAPLERINAGDFGWIRDETVKAVRLAGAAAQSARG